ncbi:MAG: DUF2207 domain-containing protein [Clostridia bacterium]|nr:DUF2207 domain-containing protein [Clostridia bacterium]
MYKPIPYHIIAIAVYACILAVCILALVFGLRAKRYVKKEKITALPRGFSPLDVQRIFIGKTYPRRLTRALIVHWAQTGYIRVEYVGRYRVRLVCLKMMPVHNSEDAAFFDRGTYVRERDIFRRVFDRIGMSVTVNINRPLITKEQVKSINSSYAAREDEGVYSTAHYKLKVITFILSFAPFVLCGVYQCITSSFVGLIPIFMMMLGMFVFRFMRQIPFWFRFIWSAMWVVPAAALTLVSFNNIFDPWGLAYASIAFLIIGSYILVQFVDLREKINLADYSDLTNYRKFLLFSRKVDLQTIDYYEALPYLYAFRIKGLVRRKFDCDTLPDWFVSPSGERGSLL